MPCKTNPPSAKLDATPKQAKKSTKAKGKAKAAPDKVFDNGATEITLDLHEIGEWLTVYHDLQ